MSDPVTNVEIEDVLSSIRRLVSDGDKARTRDPAPVATPQPDPMPEPESVPESKDADDAGDRLVLTPAFLVVDSDVAAPKNDDTAPQAEQIEADDADADEDWQEEDWPEPARIEPEMDAATETSQEERPQDPFRLTDMVFENVEDAPQDEVAANTSAPTDRAGLVATIAELEAAISSGDEDFEPDGSEVMGETIQWPGSVNRDIDTVEEAEVHEDAAPEAAEPDLQDEEIIAAFEHRPVTEVPPPAEPVIEQPDTDASVEQQPSADETQEDKPDDYADDDLDGLLDAASAGLDQDALRDLVAEVVREELTGPMGERITRNVRKLVRREIYRILSSQEFD